MGEAAQPGGASDKDNGDSTHTHRVVLFSSHPPPFVAGFTKRQCRRRFWWGGVQFAEIRQKLEEENEKLRAQEESTRREFQEEVARHCDEQDQVVRSCKDKLKAKNEEVQKERRAVERMVCVCLCLLVFFLESSSEGRKPHIAGEQTQADGEQAGGKDRRGARAERERALAKWISEGDPSPAGRRRRRMQVAG